MGIREDDSLAFALQAVAGATLSTQVLVVITTISSILSLLKVTENMVHPGGFEPPTARFVAEYSEKYKNFIVRSFFRQNILNIVFSV